MGYSESMGALADPLHEPVLLALPVFIALVAIEWISAPDPARLGHPPGPPFE